MFYSTCNESFSQYSNFLRCTYICIYIYIYIYICVCVYICVYVCVYVCMYMYIYIYIYIYYTRVYICMYMLGLGDIAHAILMRISSVKPVPWLAVNLHHLFSNGAAFNTQSRRSLTSYAISRSESKAIHLRFWTRYCVACQWTTAQCIKCL